MMRFKEIVIPLTPWFQARCPKVKVGQLSASYTANGKNRTSDHMVREKDLFRGRISLAGEILWLKINGEGPHEGGVPQLRVGKIDNCRLVGGETGIRTQVRVSPKHAFQACAFSHSAISPR